MWLVWTALGLAAVITPVLLLRRLWITGRQLVREVGDTAALVGRVFDAEQEPAPPQVPTLYSLDTREVVRAERSRLKEAARSRREARLAEAAARWQRYGLVGSLPVTMGGRPTGGAR